MEGRAVPASLEGAAARKRTNRIRTTALPLRSVVGASMLAVACAAAAVPCSVAGLAGTDIRDPRGDAVMLPAHELSNCVGLFVARGEAIACTTDRRGRGHCQAFSAGSTLQARQLSRQGQAKGAWATLASMLQGDVGRTAALSRGAGDTGLPLPTGPVMLLQTTWRVDFAGDPQLRDVQTIEVREGSPDGARVATLSPTASSLSTNRLKPGVSYWWQAISDQPGLPMHGRFSLMSATDRHKARAEWARIRQLAPRSPAAQAAMWAGWLTEQGCEEEARAVLRRAGLVAR